RGTTSFTCRSRIASSARCFRGPSATTRPPSTTSTGPRIPNSIERLELKVTAIARGGHLAQIERLSSRALALAGFVLQTGDGDVRDPDPYTSRRRHPAKPTGTAGSRRARRLRPPARVRRHARAAPVPPRPTH